MTSRLLLLILVSAYVALGAERIGLYILGGAAYYLVVAGLAHKQQPC